MSDGLSMFVALVTLVSMAGMVWLLITNRNKSSTGEELDHSFDGIAEYDNPLPAWWVALFAISVVFGVGYVFYYPALGNMEGAGGWSSEKEWIYASEKHEERFAPLYSDYASKPVEELVSNRQAMQTGRRLFLNYCSTCHGVAAKGGRSFPNLTDTEWIWGDSFETIKQTILAGRTAAMPPWEAVIQPDQLSALSSYVQALSQSPGTSDANVAGKTTYLTFCIACHGVNGKGNPALGAPDLTNDIWLYGGSMEDITHSIAKGRAGMMPAHASIIGEDQVHLLAAYVYSLRKPNAGVARSGASEQPQEQNEGSE